MVHCTGGFGDCDNNPGTGCETNIAVGDVNNCGACNNKCQAPFTTTLGCTAGACGIVACQANHADCNGVFADGCETSTGNDVNNCGACVVVCATGHTCVHGVCQ